MADVGIRQLKQQASEIVRRVREQKETITITYRGRPVAKMVPFEDTKAASGAVWAQMDEIARQIGALWPREVSVAEAVKEQRREL